MTGKVMGVGTFARVTTNKMNEYGVEKGELVYLAGSYTLPEKEDDPYTLRTKFIAARTNKGHILSEEKPFTIDPSNLKAVGKKFQEKLEAKMKEDFGDKEEKEDEGSN